MRRRLGGARDEGKPFSRWRVYKVYCPRTALGIPEGRLRCEAWLVHLDRSSLEAVTAGAKDLGSVRAEVHRSVARMRALYTEVERGAAEPHTRFRMADDPNSTCRRCKMLQLCSAELIPTAIARTGNGPVCLRNTNAALTRK